MNTATHTPTFTVRRMSELGSKQFGIYRGSVLVEGGFFNKDSARDRLGEWRGELSSSQAPRKAVQS